jgi:hypothetical protein
VSTECRLLSNTNNKPLCAPFAARRENESSILMANLRSTLVGSTQEAGQKRLLCAIYVLWREAAEAATLNAPDHFAQLPVVLSICPSRLKF